MPYGTQTGRVAYAMDVVALPHPAPGAEGRKIKSFRPGEEILEDPGLKEVFKTALEKSCATVTKPTD